MRRVLVIAPFASATGVANRAAQLDTVEFAPGIQFDFKAVRAGPALLDSSHDIALAEVALAEAGMSAQEEGYDAVCIDSTSDSGMNYLRSVLDIPVIGAGRASYLMALMFGDTFSILTLWSGWLPLYKRSLRELGVETRCVSVRAIDVPPDYDNLLDGSEDAVFPMLREAGMACINEDGADVICMGSTTMYAAVPYLQRHLPVPVVNPGPLACKMAGLALDLGVAQSRKAYPAPGVPKAKMLSAMMDAAAATESDP